MSSGITESVLLPVCEAFCSLQGEGRHTGRAAWFVRLAGCDTGCPWCDSAHARSVGAGRMTDVGDIASAAAASGVPTVIVTGGEPTMHPLSELVERLHGCGLKVHLETAGTHSSDACFDWVCLSPKSMREPLPEWFAKADELKVVISCDDDFARACGWAARTRKECRLYLQPEWGRRQTLLPRIVEYIKSHPQWRLSLQTHKYTDIP